jgi:hypothetical protein
MHIRHFMTVGAAAGAVLLALGSTAACGVGSPSVSATPSAQPSEPAPKPAPPSATAGPLAAPDSPRRIVYDATLVSDPLPASAARVSMSAQEAVQLAAQQTSISPQLQPGVPRATLRQVYPGIPSATQKVLGRPTWLITWNGSEPAVRGPAKLTKEQRRELAAQLECIFVVTVDPGSRRTTNALQLCVRKK